MRISALRINNVLGIRALNTSFRSPVVLFTGRNGAGKSSLLAAVRMALLGEPERVFLKKDYGRLVTDGAKEGDVTVTVGNTAVHMPLPDGKATPWTERPPFVDYCMRPERFPSMGPDERRMVLFQLVGVKADGQAAMKRMLERGCEARYVEAIGETLKGGFPAAHKEASDRAREAKGAWRGVTGEAWGKDKATAWKPTGAPYGENEREILRRVQNDLAEAVEAERAAGDTCAKLEDTEPVALAADPKKAARVAPLTTDIKKAEEQHEELVRTLTKHQGDLDKPESLACPHCGGMVVQDGFALKPYEGKQVDKAEARAAVGRYNESVRISRSRLENLRRDLADAQSHATRLAATTKAKASPHELEKAKEAYILAVDRTRSLREEERKLLDLERAAEAVESKTANAARHAAEVAGWLAVADATAPDGIPAELLAGALAPVNKKLQEASIMTGWPQVVIGPDMAVGAGHDYALLSESERWRTDAMLAYAIASIGGARFLLLDRLDVLDIPSRGDALAWIVALVDQGKLDGAIVCGTLKATPNVEGVESFWLEKGQILAIAEAA